ncbi:MAG: S8 family peptidase, partial [Candidatus Zixiibacteriota bacterium]
RLVCSFDTGIRGTHPALYNSWKGLDDDSLAAWFDPIDGEKFPHTFSVERFWHGTHTMGTMVGIENSIGDTIGVAPEAQWISAGVIDIPGASIIDAFEWAADPDGDPNTISDVPDVINHSWGVRNVELGCDTYFWQMIDNTEALGIVNVFAAGNDSNDVTIANPANRPGCFAVGALDSIETIDTSIAVFSSRGPSDCDGTTIKPNVVAPGVAIRSAIPGTDYDSYQGTSMAAPHVAGAVALLRQAAPDATVDEIKQALQNSCIPLGLSSPNNTFGYGLINIPSAIAALAPISNPDLRIYSYDFGSVEPGGTISAPVVIANRGGTLNDVYGKITGGAGVVTYTTDSLDFGTVAYNDTAWSDVEFQVTVNDTVTPGSLISVDFDLHGFGGYSKAARLYIRVSQKPEIGYFTHNTGEVQFTVSNYGQYGFSTFSFLPLGYSGFTFGGINTLYEATFMVGTDATHVSDGGRNIMPEPDNDFSVAPGGNLIVSDPGARANQETSCAFNDSKAERPIGLEIHQKSYSWNTAPDNQYIILEYEIRNVSDSQVPDIYAGLYLNWDAAGYIQRNIGTYSASENMGYIFRSQTGFDSSSFRGTSVIRPDFVASHRIVGQRSVGSTFFWLPYPETDKYDALSGGIVTDTITGHDTLDLAHLLSVGPFTLLPGQSDTAVFALSAANSLSELQAVALQAKDKYLITSDIEIVETDILPDNFVLHQNYPNPFNMITTVSFSLAARSEVSLSVFNLLGKRVIDLVDRQLAAGVYQVRWDGRDGRGDPVASGIYFCRLRYGSESRTRKMILLK